MKIIAFGHRRYVGKDTACNLLITHIRSVKRNVLVMKTGFASKFKAICHDIYGWAGLQDEAYYDDHPEMGTTVGRAIYPDTWLMYPLTRKCDYLILKDLRFPNEANAVLERRGVIYEIENPRIEKYDDVADTALVGYDRWTGKLINDSDLKSFNQKVIETLNPYI